MSSKLPSVNLLTNNELLNICSMNLSNQTETDVFNVGDIEKVTKTKDST